MSDQKQNQETKTEIQEFKEQPKTQDDSIHADNQHEPKSSSFQLPEENSKTNETSNEEQNDMKEIGEHLRADIVHEGDHHKLHSAWEFWYYKRPNKDIEKAMKIEKKLARDGDTPKKEVSDKVQELSYREQLKPLGKISTLEEFFSFYVYQKSAIEMPREIDLFFFRHGEVPMWEMSPQGGIWITKIRKEDDIDRMWEALLLALIGEQFGEPNVIGVSLSLRTKERLIQLWLKDAQNHKMKAMISNRMRHFLQLDPDSTTLYFKDHQSSIKDKSTMKNALGYKFEKKKKDNETKSRADEQSNQSSKGAPWSGIGANEKYSDNKNRKYSGYSGQPDRKYTGSGYSGQKDRQFAGSSGYSGQADRKFTGSSYGNRAYNGDRNYTGSQSSKNSYNSYNRDNYSGNGYPRKARQYNQNTPQVNHKKIENQ